MNTGKPLILATPSPFGLMSITSTSNSSPISMGYAMPLPRFLAFLGALFLGLKAYHSSFQINNVFCSIRLLLCIQSLAGELLFFSVSTAFSAHCESVQNALPIATKSTFP
jgi:hypothetical protein